MPDFTGTLNQNSLDASSRDDRIFAPFAPGRVRASFGDDLLIARRGDPLASSTYLYAGYGFDTLQVLDYGGHDLSLVPIEALEMSGLSLSQSAQTVLSGRWLSDVEVLETDADGALDIQPYGTGAAFTLRLRSAPDSLTFTGTRGEETLDLSVMAGGLTRAQFDAQASVSFTPTASGMTYTVNGLGMTGQMQLRDVERLVFADGALILADLTLQPRIDYTTGNDSLQGTDLRDHVRLREGDDTYFGQAGDDTIIGGPGQDYLDGGTGNDQLHGWLGDDVLHGVNGNDSLFGEAGNDDLFGGFGNDLIFGGLGNDTLRGGQGADTLWGKEGDDLILVVDDSRGSLGHTQVDTVYAGEGNDTVRSDGSAGRVWMGAGTDLFELSPIREGGLYTHLQVYAGAGNDTIRTGAEGAGKLDGGDGDDLLEGRGTFYGGAGDDTLRGTDGANTHYGGMGNDLSYLGGGNDRFEGWRFNTFGDYGENGDDTVYGGAGNDTLNGNNGDNRLYGEAGDDYLRSLEGASLLDGGDGNDLLQAAGTNDTLLGGAGDDVFRMSSGGTRAEGGAGEDEFRINDYRTYRDVGAGDTISGGAGADEFIIPRIHGDDVITDFEMGVDQLILSISRYDRTLEQVLDSATLTADGILIDLGMQDDRSGTLLLQGLTTLDGLADSLVVY